MIKGARSASTPGPSKGPYTVYKCYPQLLLHLWKILRVIWRRGWVAKWRCGEGVWIPKEKKSTAISQFRSISLLSVERKIFISILSTTTSTPLFRRVASLEGPVVWNTLVQSHNSTETHEKEKET